MRLANSLEGFDKVWPAFLSFWNFDRASLIVSIFALAVSAWVAFISRRNTKAAERSAEAAEKQANAALDQAREASNQAVLAANTSEVSALESARSRIDQNAPSVAVAISHIEHTPFIADACYDVPIPHPEPDQNRKLTLDYNHHWSWSVYFILRGTIYNDGDRVVRAYPHGPAFYPGSHPLTNEEVPVPQATVGGVYLLYPGQMALFQILVSKPVEEWLELKEKEEDAQYSRSWFYLQPGNADEPCVIVNIKTKGHPVRRQIDESGDWIRLQSGCYVTTEVERPYPSSFRWLHAELKNDNEALYWLQMHEELSRSFNEKRKRESEPE